MLPMRCPLFSEIRTVYHMTVSENSCCLWLGFGLGPRAPSRVSCRLLVASMGESGLWQDTVQKMIIRFSV